ncbi:MAG TPA: hypothetical protein VMP01_16045 [Pirellulaceae bacterium]|nr:hypothetical protein [Pirellulaceae bacterium]
MIAHMRTSLSCFVAALALFSIAVPWACIAAEPETLETVLAVWRKRETAARTLKVVISKVSTLSHGTGLEGEAIGGTRQGQLTVILDGTNFRSEEQGEFTDPGSDVPQQLLMIAANNGDRLKALTRVSVEEKVIRSSGNIHAGTNRNDMRIRSPIVLHWRALCPVNDQIKPGELKLVSTDEKIGKVRCLLLQKPHGTRGGIESFWVAPDQDMAILRRTTTQPGRLTSETDVTFKFDAKLGWIPANWIRKGYKQDGSVLGTYKATVVTTEVNPDVPKETFDILWPPGTEVYDSVARRKFYVPAKN